VTTAVDSSVLLDVLGADPAHGARSREALRAAYDAGALVACDVVWAEVRAHYAEEGRFALAMALFGIQFDPISEAGARLAGELWRGRRSAAVRDRVVADFLVGAHALMQADRLLTRDRGFYRRAFAGLAIVDPSPT
jgi:predicted nucleic acid-binding protein